MDARFVLAGGKRLEYLWIGPAPGDAPTIVFLHEGLGSAGLWRDFPARLAEAAGCGALVYSRAGYGASQAAELPRPIRFMHDEAVVLGEVLDALGIREHVLFGHSDGASISLIHAGSQPRPGLSGVIAEAPHVFAEPHGLASIARMADVYRETDLREKLARHHGGNVDIAFRGWNDVWLHPGFRAWNIEAYLPGIRVPVLVVQGHDDEYGTWAQVEAIQRQSGAPVEVLGLPECGHSPHREHPDAVLAASAGFVRRCVGAAWHLTSAGGEE
ncbi:MAG TPA: alpha/beta hydrolase [Longimicrobium sp.]|nr:alpha/beta hydrolase [Longimicrobium sp.]